MTGFGLNEARRHLAGAGWKSKACPGVPNTAGTGTSGGEWILHRPHLAVGPVLREANIVGWAGILVRTAGRDILVCSLYLRPGHQPLEAGNFERLESLTKIILCLKLPFSIAADWNCTPAELCATSWVTSIRGTIVTSTAVAPTCRAGRGAVLDYVVAVKTY